MRGPNTPFNSECRGLRSSRTENPRSANVKVRKETHGTLSKNSSGVRARQYRLRKLNDWKQLVVERGRNLRLVIILALDLDLGVAVWIVSKFYQQITERVKNRPSHARSYVQWWAVFSYEAIHLNICGKPLVYSMSIRYSFNWGDTRVKSEPIRRIQVDIPWRNSAFDLKPLTFEIKEAAQRKPWILISNWHEYLNSLCKQLYYGMVRT